MGMGGGAPHPVLNNYYYYERVNPWDFLREPDTPKNAKSLRGKGGPHGTTFWNELSFAGSAENEGASPATEHKPLPQKQMPRQHLRALFSDSSSRDGSMRPCFVARLPSQTRSQMLRKHHLPAARSLWRTQSKILSKHRPCAAMHGRAASWKSPCPSSPAGSQVASVRQIP